MEGQDQWVNVMVSPKGTVAIKPRDYCHGAWKPQAGEVTYLGWVTRLSIQSLMQSPHLPCKRGQINMKAYMDRWVTPLQRLPNPPGVPDPHVNRPQYRAIGKALYKFHYYYYYYYYYYHYYYYQVRFFTRRISYRSAE